MRRQVRTPSLISSRGYSGVLQALRDNSMFRVLARCAIVGIALALASCGASPTTAVSTPTPSPTALSSPTASATTTPTSYPVKVYFSKHPDSDSSPSAVFPVNRLSPTLSVATYAVNQLIAGPTSAEATAGYYTPLTGALSGASNCGGADFTITLDKRATTPEIGTTTLQFCRTVLLAGDLTGSRISAEITQTLLQFSNIKHVVILQRDGGCFDDLSGLNRCLSAG
jgi:hypothetical protein